MGLLNWSRKIFEPYPDDAPDEFNGFPEKNSGVSPAIDPAKSDKIHTIHTTTKLHVVVVQPEHFDDIREIADHLLERRTVVLNLERANKEAVRRIIDFVWGVIYALDGDYKPIAKNCYIITPTKSIDIMGADLIGELETTGMFNRLH